MLCISASSLRNLYCTLATSSVLPGTKHKEVLCTQSYNVMATGKPLGQHSIGFHGGVGCRSLHNLPGAHVFFCRLTARAAVEQHALHHLHGQPLHRQKHTYIFNELPSHQRHYALSCLGFVDQRNPVTIQFVGPTSVSESPCCCSLKPSNAVTHMTSWEAPTPPPPPNLSINTLTPPLSTYTLSREWNHIMSRVPRVEVWGESSPPGRTCP